MTEFGRRLKIARAAKGLNQAAFAELLGVEPASVSRWENGGGYDESRIPRIAEILGRSPDWLVGEDEPSSLARRVAELEAAIGRAEPVGALSKDEERLIAIFRGLDDNGRDTVINFAQRASSLAPNKNEVRRPTRSKS